MTYFLCLANNICLERRQGLFSFITCKQKGQKIARDFGRITKLFKRAGSPSNVLNEVKLASRLSLLIMPLNSLEIIYWLYYRLYSPTLLKIYKKKVNKKSQQKKVKKLSDGPPVKNRVAGDLSITIEQIAIQMIGNAYISTNTCYLIDDYRCIRNNFWFICYQNRFTHTFTQIFRIYCRVYSENGFLENQATSWSLKHSNVLRVNPLPTI